MQLTLRLFRLAAPNRAHGEEATWNPRPPNDLVSVVAQYARHRPAEKLLGGVELPPIGTPKVLKLGSDE
jgi:hypothetical protein